MVSLANVKAYLRITDTDATRDALISLLIPVVYQDIIAECNNLFKVPGAEISSDDIYFDASPAYKILLDAGGFAAMAWPTTGSIVVTGSKLNDGLYTISVQADTYITTTEPILDEIQPTTHYPVSVSLVAFPKPIELIASRMIGYQLANSASAGVVSMSLGNYSETRKATTGGYPDEILNSLRPWKNMTTGRGTIRWHINENRTFITPSGITGLVYGD
jgi:hypothetical protein